MNQYSDKQRLFYLFLDSGIDGFADIPEDKYDYAMLAADNNGRKEPNQQDEFEGFSMMIDAAIQEHYPDWESTGWISPIMDD